MFEIYGGATEFQQWSLDQKVINDCMDVGEEVVFRTAHSKVGISIARMDGDVIVADVPNEILTFAGNISVELGQGEERCADCYTVFAVVAQEKPEGYVCTDNRNIARKYLETVKQDLTEAEKAQVRENIGAGSGKLTYDQMPEGYPKKAIGEVTLFDQTVTVIDGLYKAGKNFISLTVGETYFVYVDGVKYECVCYDYNGTAIIGNMAAMGIPGGNGEPFYIVSTLGMCGFVEDVESGASVNGDVALKIVAYTEVVTPMAEEFLPESVKGGTVVVNITADDSGAYSADMVAEDIYNEFIGGKKAVCLADNTYIPLTSAFSNGAGTYYTVFSDLDTHTGSSPKMVIYQIKQKVVTKYTVTLTPDAT